MSKIIKYEEVKCAFEEEGFELLSKDYTNAKTKLNYICPNGHTHSISWTNFKTGYRCPHCYGHVKPSYEYVKQVFEEEGYMLLSKKYRNAKSYLYFICPEEHRYRITWDAWRHGRRCGKCVSVMNYGKGHPGWRGGASKSKYCPIWQDKEYKGSIKERDSFMCLNPDCCKKNNVLTIHHIDYDKDNCAPDNLITLCSSCNSRANKDRKWHKAWYQAILKNRYNYRRL